LLDHERLDAYKCALQFASLAFRILEELPRGHGELADQLRRAALSIPLNIADGAGKPSPNDRSRYHATARGSAMECGAVLELLGLLRLAHPETLQEGKNLLVRLVAMLTKMCR
jgi:four helix bundle protein